MKVLITEDRKVPPSSPPVALKKPASVPPEVFGRGRKATQRFCAVVERISEGIPMDASELRTVSSDIAAAAEAHDRLEKIVLEQQRLIATLMSAFRSTSDAIIATTLSGEITLFNAGAEKIFQFEDAGKAFDPETSIALGDNIFHLCADYLYEDEVSSAPDKGLMDRLKTQGTVQNLRIVFRGNRGRITHTLFSLDYVRDLNGKATGLIAMIKDNSEVERLTQVDPLTELSNRRFFDQKIREEYGHITRGHYDCVSVVFLDVDHFKDFNTTFGHQIGDQVLKTVATTLKNASRVVDTVARYGGEEFVIILPSDDEVGAKIFADRLCEAIAKTKVLTVRGELSVTASIGIATHHRTDANSTAEALIKEANLAMQAAKDGGRNQVKQSA